MKKFGMAVALVLATVVRRAAAMTATVPPRTPSSSGGDTAAKLEGSISVWIMDPGSPKIQDVSSSTAPTSRPPTRHEGRHPVRPLGAGATSS